ncbi:unnamed protein product [Arctogadus glacialis]
MSSTSTTTTKRKKTTTKKLASNQRQLIPISVLTMCIRRRSARGVQGSGGPSVQSLCSGFACRHNGLRDGSECRRNNK